MVINAENISFLNIPFRSKLMPRSNVYSQKESINVCNSGVAIMKGSSQTAGPSVKKTSVVC